MAGASRLQGEGALASVFTLLALDLERVEYDPEISAALVYRARGGGMPPVVASGAIVVMGARTVEQARAVAAEVRDVVDVRGAWHTLA